MKSKIERLALLRGYFLKKFRKYPLFALWKKQSKGASGMTGKKSSNKRNMLKFVRYAEGAKMYSMGLSKFQELAKDAKACYKVGQLVLVNTEILDEYLETFRIVEDDFYK